MKTLGIVSISDSRSLSLMSSPEMCLARRAALHSLVVSMLVRVIKDFHGSRLEGFIDLHDLSRLIICRLVMNSSAAYYLRPDRIFHGRLRSGHGRQRPSQR
jgi:hypothetical protein